MKLSLLAPAAALAMIAAPVFAAQSGPTSTSTTTTTMSKAKPVKHARAKVVKKTHTTTKTTK